MKPIKMLGLAALAALTAMAFVGASSAMAANTALCTVDESPCEAANRVHHVHETTLSGAKATLLNWISNVLCDVLFLGDVTSANDLGSPLFIEGSFTYTNCVDEKPNSCTVTEEKGPATVKVSKWANEQADAWYFSEMHVSCSGISCYYSTESILLTSVKGPLLSFEQNGEMTTTNNGLTKIKGLLCPVETLLDMRTTPLTATYIAS
jgi:hypothetical protein